VAGNIGISGGGLPFDASDFGHWATAARPPSDTPSTPANIFQRDNVMEVSIRWVTRGKRGHPIPR
jgi:hypothetical protein